MMISAGKPGNVFWALAMYLPSGEILIADLLNWLTWDSIIVASQESLSSWQDVPNDNSWTKRIHDVLIIWMEQ